MRKMKVVLLLAVLTLTMALAGDGMCQDAKKGMKPALLVIDVQNCYLGMMAEEDTTLAMPRINYAIQLFRKAGLPVIRIYHDDPKNDPKPEDESFQFPRHLAVSDKDPMIIKNYGNAFYKTELAERLKELKCNTVFLCGLSAVGCVAATHFGSYDNDLNAFLIEDALMSHDSKFTNSIEEMYDAVSLRTVKFMVEHIRQ
jgi:nicotinamidase-related amidase